MRNRYGDRAIRELERQHGLDPRTYGTGQLECFTQDRSSPSGYKMPRIVPAIEIPGNVDKINSLMYGNYKNLVEEYHNRNDNTNTNTT